VAIHFQKPTDENKTGKHLATKSLQPSQRKRSRKEEREKRAREKTGDKVLWPVTYKWVAVGTVVACTAFGTHTITLASARERQPVPPRLTQTQASPATTRFDIPAGTLGDILDTFHTLTGLDIAVSNEGIRNVSSPGVSGAYTSAQALQRLLSGTLVTYRFTGPNAVTLELAPVQQELTVNTTGLAVDQVASVVSPK
jgi:hypothetical protein